MPLAEEMFCPKCGRPLELQNGRPWCPAGDMQLSVAAESQIREAFFSEEPPAAPPAGAASLPSLYHCPRCGGSLAESLGRMACPACGREMPFRLRHALVELHPHLGWPPGSPRTLEERLAIRRARREVRKKWGV